MQIERGVYVQKPNMIWKGSPNFSSPKGYKIIAIVNHIMSGTLAGTDAWFANPASQVSSHFGVGKNGEIHQYVNLENPAWANGGVFDDGRLAKLDEEIERLIQQERALFIIEGNFSLNHELVSKLTKLQDERSTLLAELTKQDTRMARTLELEALLQGTISEFNEDLFNKIIEKIVVKERTCLVFHLKNGLAFEERYSLGRGRDIL